MLFAGLNRLVNTSVEVADRHDLVCVQWRPDYTSCGTAAPVAKGVGPLRNGEVPTLNKKQRIKRGRKEGRKKKEKKEEGEREVERERKIIV